MTGMLKRNRGWPHRNERIQGVIMFSKRLCCCCPVMSDSLQPHGKQHTRPPCPPLSPGVCSDSCPLSQWSMSHPTISSCHRLLLLPSVFPSIRVFSTELTLHSRWPNYGSFSFAFRWWKPFKTDCGYAHTSLGRCHNQFFSMGELYINKVTLTKVMVHIKWSIGARTTTMTVQEDMKRHGELGMLG